MTVSLTNSKAVYQGIKDAGVFSLSIDAALSVRNSNWHKFTSKELNQFTKGDKTKKDKELEDYRIKDLEIMDDGSFYPAGHLITVSKSDVTKAHILQFLGYQRKNQCVECKLSLMHFLLFKSIKLT